LSESGFPGFEDFQDGNLDVVGEDCLNQDFQDLRIFRMVILDFVCEYFNTVNYSYTNSLLRTVDWFLF
jgi:hypothetical protein